MPMAYGQWPKAIRTAVRYRDGDFGGVRLVLQSVAFVAGVALLQIQAHLPPPALAGWLAAPLLVLAILQRMPAAPRALMRMALCLCAGMLGFSWAAWCAHLRLDDALPTAWEGRDVQVVGVVAGLPQPFERGVRFELEVERVVTPSARLLVRRRARRGLPCRAARGTCG